MDGTARPPALVVSSVVPYPPFGGGEKRTLRLLEAIRRSGADPHLLVTEAVEESAVRALGERGIRLESVEQQKPSTPARLRQHTKRLPSPYVPALARRLAELVARERPAFVQFEHTQNAYYYDSAPGVPIVLSTHNVDSELVATLARAERPGSLAWLRLRNRRHSMRASERRAARRADAVLCVSEHDASVFARDSGRVVLVPNGVDDDLFEIDPALPEAETVLFFGRYDYEPNALGMTRFLREGWPRVASERPSARLRLVGPAMGTELAARAAASERVEAVGAVERLDLELGGSSVVLVPIWHGGGTRLKVLEALAGARPIAGTPLGVGNLGFVDEQHGLVAETPAELAEATVRLLEDRALARALAAKGRHLAERYRWSRVTRPAEQLYRTWIDHARRSSPSAGR